MKCDSGIDWDTIPDIISKDQFYKICHVSKSTARMLLQEGIVPCEYSGKKTRCYKIKKADVQEYLKFRGIYPETFSAPKGWYGKHYSTSIPSELTPETENQMKEFFEKILAGYNDLLSTRDICILTGYARTTVNTWCTRNILRHIYCKRAFYIPKKCLIEFFCSLPFRSITRKSNWHIKMLNDFHEKYNSDEVKVIRKTRKHSK